MAVDAASDEEAASAFELIARFLPECISDGYLVFVLNQTSKPEVTTTSHANPLYIVLYVTYADAVANCSNRFMRAAWINPDGAVSSTGLYSRPSARTQLYNRS